MTSASSLRSSSGLGGGSSASPLIRKKAEPAWSRSATRMACTAARSSARGTSGCGSPGNFSSPIRRARSAAAARSSRREGRSRAWASALRVGPRGTRLPRSHRATSCRVTVGRSNKLTSSATSAWLNPSCRRRPLISSPRGLTSLGSSAIDRRYPRSRAQIGLQIGPLRPNTGAC